MSGAWEAEDAELFRAFGSSSASNLPYLPSVWKLWKAAWPLLGFCVCWLTGGEGMLEVALGA